MKIGQIHKHRTWNALRVRLLSFCYHRYRGTKLYMYIGAPIDLFCYKDDQMQTLFLSPPRKSDSGRFQNTIQWEVTPGFL